MKDVVKARLNVQQPLSWGGHSAPNLNLGNKRLKFGDEVQGFGTGLRLTLESLGLLLLKNPAQVEFALVPSQASQRLSRFVLLLIAILLCLCKDDKAPLCCCS